MRMRANSALKHEFKALRVAIAALDGTLKRLATMNGLNRAQVNGGKRRRGRISAGARASLVLQGRYMGYIRQLKPRQKAQVRKIREAKGVMAAIEKARGLAGR